jgi:putative ABC transport system permease protein
MIAAMNWLDGFTIDLRLALRGLRRDWRYSAVAIVMLALALGLNVTVFTVMDAMLFRGLPHTTRSDRIVFFEPRTRANNFARLTFADFEAYRSQATSFEALAFTGGGGNIVFRDSMGRSIDTVMTRLTANSFALLGVQPAMGRDFASADELPGAAPVAIVSHHFWDTRLGKRADVIGSVVHINAAQAPPGTSQHLPAPPEQAVTIIGVMPEGFLNVYEQNVWMPLAPTPGLEGEARGRLRDAATMTRAQTDISTIHARLQADAPMPNRGLPVLKTYSQAHMAPDAPIIYGSLWVGGWFVLLIACANLANLALVRTVGRSREFVTRIALGAGSLRLTRQILLEILILAVIAGALSLPITDWSVAQWAKATASRYLALNYELNLSTLAYSAAVCLTVALLSALAPIVRIFVLGRSGALDERARGASQGPRGKRLGTVLVACQVALAIVLVSGAGILVRSLFTIVHAESGVADPQHIVVGALHLPSASYQSPESRLQYFDRLQAELVTIPGIEASSFASSLPVDAGNLRQLDIDGQPRTSDEAVRVQFLIVSPDYFRVVGTSALAGRTFNDGDREQTMPVAIVNQSFTNMFFSREEPIGRSVRGTARGQVGPWLTVVGVVPNIMHGDALRQDFKPLVYVPVRQDPDPRGVKSGGTGFRGSHFLLRTSVSPTQLAQTVRARIQALDPDVILEDFGTLQDSFVFDRDRMDLEHADLGKHAAVAPALAVIALLLAAIGLYAVIAHSVSQRTKEIGVRLAIGAAASDIRRMVRREGMRPVAVGLVAGLAMSLGVNRLLQSQLVGVSPYDPVTIAGGAILLLLVALLACQLPIRKAAQTDPAIALRND